MRLKFTYTIVLWAILLGCPFTLFSQTETFRFYDEANGELIEEYYLVLYKSELKKNFQPNSNFFVDLPRKLIYESDSIYLITNFQQIKLLKSQFDTPHIYIHRSNTLDEVVIDKSTNKRFWIGDYKGKKSKKTSNSFSFGVAIKLGDRLPAKLLTLEIPIRGWDYFLGTNSYQVKFGIDLRLADSDFNHVGNLSVNELTHRINKRGSHKVYLDVSDYDFIIDNKASYLIVMFKHFDGRYVSYSVANWNKATESFTVSAIYDHFTKEPRYNISSNGSVKRVKAELEEL